MSGSNALQVTLGEQVVGVLELEAGGLDVVRFSTTESYRAQSRRAVLSQALEDDLTQVWSSRVRAPAFFSNLLPEGVLRELLAQRASIHPTREFFLLAELGEDLPGNVFVRPLGALDGAGEVEESLEARHVDVGEPLRFSIAGLQLKFSVNQRGNGWVLPVRGAGGRWLAKLPSARFAHVPRNEYWMMRFARRLGLDVADVQLAEANTVGGLEPLLSVPAAQESHVLLVRRFDRTEGALRIHTEDLLQVLGRHPSDKAKYSAANAEWVGRLVLALDPTSLEEFVRRLVFNVVIGNGDAHLKNWMLRYEDGYTAKLSPAFDLVSTIQYTDTDQHEFALNVARSKRYDQFSVAAIEQLARKLTVPGRQTPDAKKTADEARRFGFQAIAEWQSLADELSVPAEFSRRLAEHWKRVPLLSK